MPRYYFDIDDGKRFTQDLHGLELDGIEAAKAVAQNTLTEIAKDLPPDGDQRDFDATVRDRAGQPVLRIRLLLRVERL
ncbi:DUF6894 family protein [Microvirga arsenatis]|uniref:DUF6894 domain-containing protein n=1 Tax=Microvirga arsenatis TaxID=2692265 RepID=A0ABW9YUK5_9HYPH|nr:hypothetical protein [Microvirga arsenatis]NBJ09332.1 hypothetical protein [Microvirga arsenatis]NBJ23810.1 hypothetical protein [Microvirga arsenatis]